MATQIDPVNNIKVKVILQVFSFLSFFLENRCELTNLARNAFMTGFYMKVYKLMAKKQNKLVS